MEHVAAEIEDDVRELRHVTETDAVEENLLRLAERLRGALQDDQAERAAFLHHFPHLCKETPTGG